MTDAPHTERETQDRVVALFSDPEHPDCLGYQHLGDWHGREKNRGIEPDLLEASLARRGYSSAHISGALLQLQAAANSNGKTLYAANWETHRLLRYGAQVQVAAGVPHDTVHFVDWVNRDNNDFGIAEEVTLRGGYERRPDLVLYINGIAIGVIELKRSSVEIGDGVRQLITNQEEIFNKWFFSTVQLVFAGSDSQGLRYGTVGTEELFFVEWKAVPTTTPFSPGALLDRPLAEMCNKSQLLDWIYDFMVFDAGTKKVPRPHQYVAAKAAQDRLKKHEGGVIWHTQGSGKSILMVLLAKWILEYDPNGRVLVFTDRDELDKQISGVMKNAGVIGEEASSPRVESRADLVHKIGESAPRVICALMHKIDLTGDPPPMLGNFYVFVDECHRSQGGDMNTQMKRWFGSGIFIGFTGTPLLRKDKTTTRKTFGSNIHTYKFYQAVEDKVVLDLKYEARKVPEKITEQAAIDAWFTAKTSGLNKYQQAILRQRWATMQELMSADERKRRIVSSILLDFGTKPRLVSDRGTAMLVASSIYEACGYFRVLREYLGSKCAIITSYEPDATAITTEPAGSDERFKFDTYKNFVLASGQTTSKYEELAKSRFIKEPANLKVLIVVNKLLTGFDAPSCSYLYLDTKLLHDHNLFQAICRTNRLDGEDKDFGYIVDFNHLFEQVQNTIAVYNAEELDDEGGGGGGGNNVDLKDWLKEGKKQLDLARESLGYLCESVKHPQHLEHYILYFCGDANDPEGLVNTEPLRISFYKAVATFARAYAEIADSLTDAGYTAGEIVALKAALALYTERRSAIKKYSCEELDVKPFERDMRQLINMYIHADAATDFGTLSSVSLTDLIIKSGIHEAIAKGLNAQGKLSKKSVAETIVNNVRKTIVREQLTDPRFYTDMSKLLDDLIAQQKDGDAEYEKFLKDAEALFNKMHAKGPGPYPPRLLGHPLAIVVYRNLPSFPATKFVCPTDDDDRAVLALEIESTMWEKAPAHYKGVSEREAEVKNALYPVMNRDKEATLALFELLKNQPGSK